jgi:hypothetical protein
LKPPSILEALETIVGENLTPAVAKRLAEAPAEQVRHLLHELIPYYGSPISQFLIDYSAAQGLRNPFYCSIDPELPEPQCVNEAEIQRFAHVAGQFRNSLLYLERVALPDPFDFLFTRPLSDLIRGSGEVKAFCDESDSFLEQGWGVAVSFLEAIAPLVRAHLVNLVPYRWLSAFNLFIRALQYNTLGEPFGKDAVIVTGDSLEPVNVGDAIGPIASNEERETIAVAITFYDLLSNMNLIPLARTDTGRRALEVMTALKRVILSGHVRGAATGVLVQNELPGVARIPIETIVALRLDDEAFQAWRTSFSEVMVRAQTLPFRTEAEYRANLIEAADDLLKPKIREIDKSLTGSRVLRDLVKPHGLQIGVGGVIALMTHNPVGLLGAASTALVKFGVDSVNKKVSRSTRRSQTLRDVYAYVVSTPSSK